MVAPRIMLLQILAACPAPAWPQWTMRLPMFPRPRKAIFDIDPSRKVPTGRASSLGDRRGRRGRYEAPPQKPGDNVGPEAENALHEGHEAQICRCGPVCRRQNRGDANDGA